MSTGTEEEPGEQAWRASGQVLNSMKIRAVTTVSIDIGPLQARRDRLGHGALAGGSPEGLVGMRSGLVPAAVQAAAEVAEDA